VDTGTFVDEVLAFAVTGGVVTIGDFEAIGFFSFVRETDCFEGVLSFTFVGGVTSETGSFAAGFFFHPLKLGMANPSFFISASSSSSSARDSGIADANKFESTDVRRGCCFSNATGEMTVDETGVFEVVRSLLFEEEFFAVATEPARTDVFESALVFLVDGKSPFSGVRDDIACNDVFGVNSAFGCTLDLLGEAGVLRGNVIHQKHSMLVAQKTAH